MLHQKEIKTEAEKEYLYGPENKRDADGNYVITPSTDAQFKTYLDQIKKKPHELMTREERFAEAMQGVDENATCFDDLLDSHDSSKKVDGAYKYMEGEVYKGLQKVEELKNIFYMEVRREVNWHIVSFVAQLRRVPPQVRMDITNSGRVTGKHKDDSADTQKLHWSLHFKDVWEAVWPILSLEKVSVPKTSSGWFSSCRKGADAKVLQAGRMIEKYLEKNSFEPFGWWEIGSFDQDEMDDRFGVSKFDEFDLNGDGNFSKDEADQFGISWNVFDQKEGKSSISRSEYGDAIMHAGEAMEAIAHAKKSVQVYRATYNCTGRTDSSEISFTKGETIRDVVNFPGEESDDWMLGTVGEGDNANRGLFPVAYAEKVTAEKVTAESVL